MPNTVNFGGRNIVEPGVYSQILGQVPIPTIIASYANLFLIDTGSQGQGAGQVNPAFGGGSGINGQLLQNGAAIYSFTNSIDFKKFVRGGLLYDLADYLFTPSLNGNGPVNVYHGRAATTTAPQFTFNLPSVASVVGTVPVTNTTTIAAPALPVLTPSTAGGTLAANTYYYKITALNINGETIGSPEANATTTGATSSIAISWAAVTNATSYKIYRGTATGAESVYYTSSVNSFTDTGAASTVGTVPVTNTTGIATPGLPVLTGATTGGALAAATYFYKVTALNINGETIGSAEASVAVTGATSSIAIIWGAVTNASSYKIYRGTAAGAESVYFTSTTNAFVDTGGFAGTLVFDAKNEGLGSNGVLNVNGVVSRGYGCKIKAGIINTAAFIIEFYEGQFRGLGADGVPYDGITEASIARPYIVASSIEFTTAAQFIAWATSDSGFNQYFVLDALNTTSAATISATVLTTYANAQVFTGGTTTYSLTALQTLLDNITDYDNSAFLCDDYGVTPTLQSADIIGGANKGGLSTFNQAILTHIQTRALYTQKTMYIGGGQDSTQYTTTNSDGSRDQAAFYNNPNTVVVHSAVKVPSTIGATGVAFKYNSSLYNAAMVCGRIAGLQPQVPGTWKDIRVIGLKHELTQSLRVDALQHGVLHIRRVTNLGWVINQSVNTKQVNASIVYNDGTSPEISIMRIIHQLNKELYLNALQFVGGNLNTVSGDVLTTFTNSYLLKRTAEPLADNLILPGPHQVVATYANGAWNVRYCFRANAPINQIFFTGFLIDPAVVAGNQAA